MKVIPINELWNINFYHFRLKSNIHRRINQNEIKDHKRKDHHYN